MEVSEFATDVRNGLCRAGQKQLPAKYLYDPLGSTLFEAITMLPEYGLTRADQRLLNACAEDALRLAAPQQIIELGSGSGRKARRLLEVSSGEIPYTAIDLSAAALDRCRLELHGFNVRTVQAGYLDGLTQVTDTFERRVLVLFLGSTIGNFSREGALRFLEEIRRWLRPGDSFLLGTDLVKPLDQMLAAYDDPTGVTAAFNRNVLGRINRELGGDFDLRSFRHEVRYNGRERRIEMHLRSSRKQTVTIPRAGVTVAFEEGETIWTESSHKFQAEEAAALGAQAGFHKAAQWIDELWPFAETLFVA
jgi:probable methyltransferase